MLSLGKLCNESKFDYIWRHGQTPYLQKGNGAKQCCFPKNALPFITSGVKSEEVKAEGNLDQEQTQQVDSESDREIPPLVDESDSESEKRKLKKEKVQKPEIKKEAGGDSKPRKTKQKNKKVSCQSCEHNIWTHFPKDPNCEVCREATTDRAHCRTKTHGPPDDLPEPVHFWDAVTADHAILNEDDKLRKRQSCVRYSRPSNLLAPRVPSKNQKHARHTNCFSKVSRSKNASKACLHRQLERVHQSNGRTRTFP